MTRLEHPTAWRTLAALALLFLAHRAAPADEMADRLSPVEAALKAGDRGRADRLSESLAAGATGNTRPTLQDATLLYKLDLLYSNWGYYAQAQRYAQEFIALCNRLPEDTDRARLNKQTARLQANMELAYIYRAEEDYVRAGNQYELCQNFLKDSPAILAGDLVRWRLDNNRGRLYELTGQYDEAERYYQRAFDFLVAHPAPEGPRRTQAEVCRALTLNNLGWLYHGRGKEQGTPAYQKAKKFIEEARAIRERVLAPDDDAIAESLNNLGLCEYSLGDAAAAKSHIEKAVTILRTKQGKNYPPAARYEHNLAAVCRSLGESGKALELQKNSLAVLERALPEGHPDVAAEHGYMAWQYAAGERWSEAAVEVDQARRIFHHHIRHVLSAQSENEQLRFLATKDQPWFHVALTIALKAGDDPATNAMAVNWVLNGKAITPEVLGERYVLARRSLSDPNVETIYRKLLTARGELAARSLRSATPAGGATAAGGGAGASASTDSALRSATGAPGGGSADAADPAADEAKWSRELGLALKYDNTEWVEVPAVQKRVLAGDRLRAEGQVLTGNAVLIDFAKFTYVDFRAATSEPSGADQHYAAWVVPPDGPAHIVDLGPAAAIDAAVQRLQDTMKAAIPTNNPEDPRTIITLGEQPSEELYVRRSAELGRLLLGKVYPYAGGYRRWVISPDDNLWLIPWAAVVLPAGDKAGRYAVEKHTISVVASGRNLLARPPTDVRPGKPLIFADADFGEAQRDRPGLEFPPLKYSAAEADAIRPLLSRYAGEDPVVLSGGQATESAFRRAESPKVVVLSTHGFFLDKKADEKRLPVNPFLRCGLALAGANLRDQRPAGDNDGIVFGEEILTTNLRGTDLVVLSACETALGKVRNGEGVANLQSAFQQAGAQAVVGTLWEVQDKQTGKLMRDYFRHLADDRMDKAEALRQAQLDRIKERLASPDRAAHPFFWAAPVLTGQWARTLDR
jgi:tetratricopeptide (TPR) repeat protein